MKRRRLSGSFVGAISGLLLLFILLAVADFVPGYPTEEQVITWMLSFAGIGSIVGALVVGRGAPLGRPPH